MANLIAILFLSAARQRRSCDRLSALAQGGLHYPPAASLPVARLWECPLQRSLPLDYPL